MRIIHKSVVGYGTHKSIKACWPLVYAFYTLGLRNHFILQLTIDLKVILLIFRTNTSLRKVIIKVQLSTIIYV